MSAHAPPAHAPSGRAPAPPPLTAGRLLILFQGQLHADGHAALAWTAHREGPDWDHAVEHGLEHALHSYAARCHRAGTTPPTVVHRNVRGGIAEATAAASQLLGRAADLRVLVVGVRGPGQARDVAELGAALVPAVGAQGQIALFVADWKAHLGHSESWERVFTGHELAGPDAPERERRESHPVLDALEPDLPALPTGR